MKKWFPWLMLVMFLAWALAALAPRREEGFHITEFGRLPVLLNGRIQPLDSVARNALLQMRGKQTAPIKVHFSVWSAAKRGKSMSASQWLIEVFARPDLADTRKVFRVDNLELINVLKLPEMDENAGEDGKHYSWNQIEPSYEIMRRESTRINDREQAKESDASHRTPFERAVMKLQNALILYQRLKVSLAPEGTQDFAKELAEFQSAIAPGIAAVRAQEAGREFNTNDFHRLVGLLERLDFSASRAYPLMVPPNHPETDPENWRSVGMALMETVRGEPLNPAIGSYYAMAAAYRNNQPAEFNQAVAAYRTALEPKLAKEVAKGRSEFFFTSYEFFYKAMNIYVMAFLFACASWFIWSSPLRRAAYYLMALGFVIHSVGLVYRMVLEGRPPVTNLYSSAIFIGWGVVLFCLFLERIYPLALATAVSALGGFVTLVIAHNLALGGDTMEMLQAVLDTNFWLATHVVVVTLGYASTFLAGTMALFYIVLGLFTDKLNRPMTQGTGLAISMTAGLVGGAKAGILTAKITRDAVGFEVPAKVLGKMVYGIICFATLFSFVGTVLGGIWADQSWGRFWGWDPKENGALIIVLWNALILHARWGGLVRERGLMNLAVFGNIVTSYSWFGVNMLGIGLHSYGFMDAAFKWLMLFIASQLFLIALGLIPPRYWRSFRDESPVETGRMEPVPVGK